MKGRLRRLFRYDMKNGIQLTFYRYLFAVIMLMFISRLVLYEIELFQNEINFWDVLYHVFEGIPRYTQSDDSFFELPVLILLFQCTLLFVIGNYPWQDIHGYGRNVFMQSGKRRMWWSGKVIWTVENVVLYYGVFLFVLAANTVFDAVRRGMLSGIFQITTATTFLSGCEWEYVKNLVFLPLLTLITMALMQLCFSVFLKPLWAYVTVMAILVLSSYYSHFLWIGNYLMMQRNLLFAFDGCYTFEQGVAINIVVLIVMLAAGTWQMKRYEVL